jgi:hypothetical protein
MTGKAYDILKEAEKFGSKKQNDGTVLIGRTPHVAPEAWYHLVFAPLKERDLEGLEKKLKRAIPKSYRKFLGTHNGLILFSGSLSLDGYKKSYDRTSNHLTPFDLLTVNVYERPEDALDSHFFIGGYDWDGSLLYVEEKSKEIFRCTRDSVQPLNDWLNLDTLLEQEVARLNQLFKQGKKKVEDQPTTPQ